MPHRGTGRVIRRRRRAGLAAAVLCLASAGMAMPLTSSAATSTWTQLASGPAGQFGAMAYDQATGTDVLFTESGQTWTWNGTAWTQQSPAASPQGRLGAGIAYDPVHQQVVLFGGETVSGSTFFDDTWTWNGTTWTQQQPTVSPPTRLGASMAWDSAQKRVILFGGFGDIAVFFADTWAWNGSSWTELTANAVTEGAGPDPRAGAMMSDDEANNSVVMFGGVNATGALGDTWVWYDGGTAGQWTKISTATSPVARGGGKLAYSSTAKAPVLFGGLSASSTLLSDTWTWDGGGWSQATPTGQPAARQNAAMATAPDGGVVMIGGQESGGAGADAWEWSGAIDSAPLPAATVVSCPAAGPMTVALPTTTGTSTLRGAAAATHPGLYIGSALPSTQQMQVDVEDQLLAGTQENLIVSSNQMYWSADEPQEGVFNFCDGDQFAGMAAAYHQTLRLHNLVAGEIPSQVPNWVNTPSIPWTKASLEAVMKQYITTTMQHYKGKVKVYDVANEALDNNGNVVPNIFSQVIGYPQWVEDAFDDAYAADPTATLIYDDYNDWYDNAPTGDKETQVYNLVSDLVPHHITAVGFELFGTGTGMLPGSGQPQSASLAAAMAKFAALNNGTMQTAITQMTVPFFSLSPSAGEIAAEAKVYGYAMNACLQPASHCIMLNTWAIDEEGGPAFGAVIYALAQPNNTTNFGKNPWGGALFDDTYQPRPAFYTVLAELQQTAPGSLTATAGAGQVALSWTAATSSAGPITGYEVYRGTSTGSEQPYQSLGASATSFTDTAVTSGTTYYYTVSGINATGDGPQSTEASATP
ncbi:MAG TPA: endo-1,4-beta-xylanase [Candidatus Dormibacteraeota bacterium]|nr:endo-1,4-beta-xylanase [Candidatus Dormibacteraeota bacterium]